MWGAISAAIGGIADLLGIASGGRGLIDKWKGRHKVHWLNAPRPPEKLPKIEGRLVHPDHINLNATNKVFLVGTNAASCDKVRYLVRANRQGGESCFVYDLRTVKRIRDLHNEQASVAWNDFFGGRSPV